MSDVQGVSSLKVCSASLSLSYFSFTTGVLTSAKSAAIGLPIRVWMFSTSPMPKVCCFPDTCSEPRSPCLHISRVLQRLRLLQGTHSPTHPLRSFADRTGSGQTLTLPHTWPGTRTLVGQVVVAPRLLPRSPGSRQPIGGLSTLSTRFPYPQSTRQSSVHFHHPPG
jgi:hypothetical protein